MSDLTPVPLEQACDSDPETSGLMCCRVTKSKSSRGDRATGQCQDDGVLGCTLARMQRIGAVRAVCTSSRLSHFAAVARVMPKTFTA